MKFRDNETKTAARTQLEEMLEEVSFAYPEITGKLGVAIDIGANVGAFSVRYHNNFNTIVAIEPNFDTMIACGNNLIENGVTNVRLFNYAVNDTNGTVKLYKGKGDISGNASTTYEEGEYEEVPAIDFKGVMDLENNNYVDYMKIDCEGAEYKFLQDQDLSKVLFLAGEYHGEDIQEQNRLWDHIKKTHELSRVRNKNVFWAINKKSNISVEVSQSNEI